MLSKQSCAVLLISADPLLMADLDRILGGLGLRVKAAAGLDRAGMGMEADVVLLDGRMPEVASGRLMAAMEERGVHQRCAIALLADQVSDEWIARLREGVIDDIVPRHADAAAWKTHVNTMQRSHALARELDQMREAALVEKQYDVVTGAFRRDAMLTILFRETDRAQRLQSTLCLMLLSVDDLARWHADLGQTGGDRLLKQVAQRMTRMQRSYDVLGRMADAELLLALPGCSLINAVLLAERLRVDVFGETFWVKNADGEIVEVRLSGCFGITASRGRSPVVVVREVEQTLALAQRMGPDSMRCAGDAPLGNTVDRLRLFPEVEVISP